MTALIEQYPDAILVALDTDPNEDVDRVVDHIDRNGFKGTFAIAPQELTNALVEQFGPSILSVPTVPVVLLSSDQSEARLLDRGLKDADELQSTLEAEK